MPARRILLALAASLLTTFSALPASAEQLYERLTLNAFGTLAATRVNVDGLAFSHPSAANRYERIRYLSSPDSVLGAQGIFAFDARTRATVQAHIAPNHQDRIRPRIAWAYLSHELTPQLTVRGGRLRLPMLMNSDSHRINFRQPWVRQPVEVYGLNPFFTLDGADLLYRRQWNSLGVEIQPYAGEGRDRIDHGHIHTSNVHGINFGLVTPTLRLHLGHGRGNVAMYFGDPLARIVANHLETLGKPDLAQQIAHPRSRATYTSAGFEWDLERLRLAGEVVQRNTPSLLPRAFGWHLSAAWTTGAFTPFLTLARVHAPGSHMPVEGDPLLDLYSGSRSFRQKSVSAGVRWDASENVAYKLQWMRARVPNNALGSFLPLNGTDPLQATGRTINSLTVSVDFFF